MKREELKLQHKRVKFAIEKNVDTIKSLIEESNNMKKIIAYCVSKWVDHVIVNELQKSLNRNNEYIKDLLNQTNNIFDSYMEFIKIAFNK